jgi:alkylation response protein AidB-like acyl-CoA dehydrogenase
MPIAVTDEHQELRQAARRWVERYCPSATARAGLDAPHDALPEFWGELAAQGWLGLHVPEDLGGEGFGFIELAVVLEVLGYGAVPGPFLPSVTASALIVAGANDVVAKQLLPGLCDGSFVGAVALPSGVGHDVPVARIGDDGALRVSGRLAAVLGAPLADLLVFPFRLADSPATRWAVLEADAADGAPKGLTVNARASLDPTRRSGEVLLDEVRVPRDRILASVTDRHVVTVAVILAGAEIAGAAGWALERAAEHARTRVQFGRPIGQFQGIKHKLADLACAVEQMTALAWDAALALDTGKPAEARLCADSVGALALDGGVGSAKDLIQVLGGIGFTWEHDAHVYLRRATTLRQLLGGSVGRRAGVAVQALAGTRRSMGVELPPEATATRERLVPLVERVAAAPLEEHRRLMGESGLLFPHWPEPYGRGAGAVEQLVIDALLAEHGLRRPPAHVASWALPTLIAHGTKGQQERWIMPTLRGELLWCQLFSEPGAGSDLAALSTKATKVEGGWSLTGQKVWTSVAAHADVGICLARTNTGAPKHQGITYFLVDMKSEGLDVRPLREVTGESLFNEVFFNDVFVPDDAVIGNRGEGWRIGRTTLSNERVSMGSGAAFGHGVESLLRAIARLGTDAAPVRTGDLGHLLVEAQSLALLGLRSTLRTLSGVDPGSGSSVRKLLGVEHEQRVQEMGMAIYGADGAVLDGDAQRWEEGFLATRCLTIAGGTSEVQRNVIAERMLGQPRDPEPGT